MRLSKIFTWCPFFLIQFVGTGKSLHKIIEERDQVTGTRLKPKQAHTIDLCVHWYPIHSIDHISPLSLMG